MNEVPVTPIRVLASRNISDMELIHFSQPQNYEIPPHSHATAVITIILDGSFHETIEGSEHHCVPGTIMMKPAGALHTSLKTPRLYPFYMMKMIFLVLATICFVSSTESSSYLKRDVSFQNGLVRLSGSIVSPATPGTHPAVVFLQGSGCTPQSMSMPIAEKFAEIGVGSLIFEKRGCGNSTGSWIDSSLQDLAKDAIAALEFCKTQKDVNPKKIGFWAVSQSGWIAPLAVSMTPDVSFLIVVSGGGTRPEVAERYAYRSALQEHGFSEDDQKQASQLLDLYFQYLRDGKNHDELMNAIAEARNKPWYSQVRLDKILPTEEARLKWQWVADFDPQPYEEEIRCPVLLFFGGKDPFQPADTAANAWKTALEKAGNSNYTIKVFPEAGHAMTLGPHHPGNQTYVNGYIETMLQWLVANVIHLN